MMMMMMMVMMVVVVKKPGVGKSVHILRRIAFDCGNKPSEPRK
jgi:hypothetical protein